MNARRGRRWPRVLLLLFLGLVTLIALLYAVENFRGARAWKQYQDEARARGAKLHFGELIPAPIPDAENAASTPLVDQWFSHTEAARWPDLHNRAEKLIKKRNKHGERYLTDLAAWQQALTNADSSDKSKIAEMSRAEQEHRAAAPAVLAALEGYSDALAELATASQKPRVRYPINYNAEQPFAILLPHLAKIRSTANVLRLRASAHLAAGNSNAALQDVQLLLWLTDSLKDEHLLINQLVRVACLNISTQPIWEGIEQQRWTDAQLKLMQERLAAMDFLSNFESCMETERAAGLTTIEWVRKTGRFMELSAMDANGERARRTSRLVFKYIYPSGWYRMEAANYGRMLDEQVQGAVDRLGRTIDAQRLLDNEQRLKKTLATARIHYLFARMLIPAFANASKRFGNGQATAHQAALACAIERYRLANGKLPETLDALVPTYFSRLPHDPLTGQPMQYERQGESGYTLASVGWPDLAPGRSKLKPDALKAERNKWTWRSAPSEQFTGTE